MDEWLPIAIALTVLLWSTAATTRALALHGPADLPGDPAQLATSAMARHDASDSTLRLGDLSLDLARAGRDALVKRPRGFRDDCSGFVSAIVTAAGVPMDGRVRQLWDSAGRYDGTHHNPIPMIGDLAYFDNTNDANKNGLWDDERTHVALVIDVEPDGTVVMVHRGAVSGRSVLRMNLFRPHEQKDDTGRVLNQHLRIQKPGDPSWAMYLTGELWSGFSTVGTGEDHVASDSNTFFRRARATKP